MLIGAGVLLLEEWSTSVEGIEPFIVEVAGDEAVMVVEVVGGVYSTTALGINIPKLSSQLFSISVIVERRVVLSIRLRFRGPHPRSAIDALFVIERLNE